MRLLRIRLTIGKVMVAIAAIAVALAIIDQVITYLAPTLAILISVYVIWTKPGRRLDIAAWVVALYAFVPPALLYATWLTAWLVLGHRPVSSLNDPKYISRLVDVPYEATHWSELGLLVSLVACLLLIVVEVVLFFAKKRVNWTRVGLLVVLTPVSWFLAYWLFCLGEAKFRVFEWFMD
jgi:hypothetical protein